MKIFDERLPKICHAKVGDLIRLPDSTTEIPEDAKYYIICADSSDKKLRMGRAGMMHGLYDDERPLFLVDLESGEAIKCRTCPHEQRLSGQIGFGYQSFAEKLRKLHMKNKILCLPYEWQMRIKQLPTIQDRAALAVFLIRAYRTRREINQDRALWRQDMDLGHLAFWPKHLRTLFFRLHSEWIIRDPAYRRLVNSDIMQVNGLPICAAQNRNTRAFT